MSNPSGFGRGRFAVQILILGAIVASLFVAGCGSSTPATSAPTITSASSAAFTVGVAGSFTVTATGSPAPTLAETGALPSGVTFNAATGALSGTPANGTTGTYPLTFTAHNGIGTDATQNFILSVVAPPVATSLTAGASTITAGSSTTLTAVFSGGTGSIDNSVGAVTSGTPVTIKPSATTTYKLTVTNSAGATATVSTTVTVVATPAISSFTAGQATITVGNTTTLTAVFTGGTGNIDNGVGSATSGTPISVSPTAATTYTLTVTNAAGTSVTAQVTVNVQTPPAITSANNTTFIASNTGTFVVTTTGNPTPAITEVGALPSGISFVDNGNGTATLSGSTTTTGNTTITITANNGIGTPATQTFTLTVGNPPAITNLNPTSGVVGTSVTITGTGFGASQGSSTVTFSGTSAGTASAWSDTSITVNVPTGATTGTGNVVVTVSGVASNGASFTVDASCTTNCSLSGTITGPWVQGVTITLTGPSPATTNVTTTTDASGNYSFTGLASGTYTVTPSLTGYTYTPSSQSVTVNTSTTQDFTAASASGLTSYSISGKVSYSGTAHGITYIRVLYCSGCNEAAGTTLAAAPSSTGTSYTIRGLSPGTYTISAEIDAVGTGSPNLSNPEGSIATVTISSSDLTNENIIIGDRTPPAAQTPTIQNVSPANGTAIIQFKEPTDSSDIDNGEYATSYKLYYGTDSTTSSGPITIAAGNTNNVYILSGLTDGTQYYFKMVANNVNGDSTASSFGPVTIGATTGSNTVSGTVTFTGSATGPMYVALVSTSAKHGAVLGERIANPVSPQAFSIAGVAADTYQFAVILDMNANGAIDPGDITNFSQFGPPPITVSGNVSNENVTLTSAPATIFVTTNHALSGGTNSYSINLGINFGSKRPVSMTLFSGPNVSAPFDMVADFNNSYQPLYDSSSRPTVGDTYQFLVTFSDGTTAVLSSQVTAVLDSFAQNLAMNSPVAGTATAPVLNWAAPATPPSIYTYSVGLSGSNEFWNYYGNTNGNGMPSTTLNVPFNVDNSANPSSTLTTGTSYQWWVTVMDANGNSAQQFATYVP